MVEFLTRIELHGATHGDASYDILHKEMKKRFFHRAVPTNGGLRHLPTAEYYSHGKVTAKYVCGEAKAAADATEMESSIITAEMTSWYTHNLPLVKPGEAV